MSVDEFRVHSKSGKIAVVKDLYDAIKRLPEGFSENEELFIRWSGDLYYAIDVDFNLPPNNSDPQIQRLFSAPSIWFWRTHGGGARLIVPTRTYAVATAAFAKLIFANIPHFKGVEIKQDTRHPLSLAKGKICAPQRGKLPQNGALTKADYQHLWSQLSDLATPIKGLDKAFPSYTVANSDLDEFAEAPVGARFSHQQCPFDPTDDDKNFAVVRYEDRVWCHRCKKAAYFEKKDRLTAEGRFLRAQVNAGIWWGQAKYVLATVFPGLRQNELREIFRLIVLAYAKKPAGFYTNRKLDQFRWTATGWEYNKIGLKHTNLNQLGRFFSLLPAVQTYETDEDGNGKWKVDQDERAAWIGGAHKVVALDIIQAPAEFVTPSYRDGRLFCADPDLRPNVEIEDYEGDESRLEWAKSVLDWHFDGFPFRYAAILTGAFVEALDERKPLPMVVAKGPSGSGKSIVPRMVAAALGVDSHLANAGEKQSKSLSDQLVQLLADANGGFVIFDEAFGDVKHRPIEEFLEIGREVSGHKYYTGTVSIEVRAALVFTNTEYDINFLQSSQVLRRSLFVNLEGGLKDWVFDEGVRQWFDASPDLRRAVGVLLGYGIWLAKNDLLRSQADMPTDGGDEPPVVYLTKFLKYIADGNYKTANTKKYPIEKNYIEIDISGDESVDDLSFFWHEWAGRRAIPLLFEECGYNLSDVLCVKDPVVRITAQRARRREGGLRKYFVYIRFSSNRNYNTKPNTIAKKLLDLMPENVSYFAGYQTGLSDKARGRYRPNPKSWYNRAEWLRGYVDAFDGKNGGGGGNKPSPTKPKKSRSKATTKSAACATKVTTAQKTALLAPVQLPSKADMLQGVIDKIEPADERLIYIDIETRSPISLKKIGNLHKYLEHPETQPVVFTAVCFNPKRVWVWGPVATLAEEEVELLENRGFEVEISQSTKAPESLLNIGGYQLVAHNAEFERAVLARFSTGISSQAVTKDTLLEARRLGFGVDKVGLDAIAKKFGLPAKINKDAAMKWLVPSGRKGLADWTDEGKHLVSIYCLGDTFLAAGVYSKLAEENSKFKKVCELKNIPLHKDDDRSTLIAHFKINETGLPYDAQACKRLIEAGKIVLADLGKEVEQITKGEIGLNNVKRETTAKWLEKELEKAGIPVCLVPSRGKDKAQIQARKAQIAEQGGVVDLQRGTIEKLLQNNRLSEPVKKVLLLRLEASGASSKKLEAALREGNSDGRLRGQFKYFGAHTGRFSGQGVQPQNFSRTTGKYHPDQIYEMTSDLDRLVAFAKDIGLAEFGKQTVRSVIRAEAGHKLLMMDFSQIEARLLAWVAGEKEALESFATGDPYKAMASKIFGKPVNEITKQERQVGKALVLACGYGMGATAFERNCKKQGLDLSKVGLTAQTAVNSFRKARGQTVVLWRELENKAFDAIAFGDAKVILPNGAPVWFVALNKTKESADLVMILPNGRPIFYRGVQRVPKDDTGQMELRHKNKRLYGGLLTENLIQALARDLMAEVLKILVQGFEWQVVGHVHDEVILQVPEYYDDEKFERYVKGALAEGFKILNPSDRKVALPLPIAAAYFTAQTFAKGPLEGEERKIEVLIKH